MGTMERNYSISQKHHLPFVNQGCHGKCFSFNTGLAEGGSSTDCTTEMYPLFLYMLLFNSALGVAGWGDYCLWRSSCSCHVRIWFVSLHTVKYNASSMKSYPCLERAHYVLFFFLTKNVTSMQNSSRGIPYIRSVKYSFRLHEAENKWNKKDLSGGL